MPLISVQQGELSVTCDPLIAVRFERLIARLAPPADFTSFSHAVGQLVTAILALAEADDL